MMKSTKLTYLLVLGIALTFAATGCKHKPVRSRRCPDNEPRQSAVKIPAPATQRERLDPPRHPWAAAPERTSMT